MTVPIEQDCPSLAVVLSWWAGLNSSQRRHRLLANGRNYLRLDNVNDVGLLGTIYANEHGLKAPDKVGRNEQCPCGSGRKFKKCCME